VDLQKEKGELKKEYGCGKTNEKKAQK